MTNLEDPIHGKTGKIDDAARSAMKFPGKARREGQAAKGETEARPGVSGLR